MIPPDLPPRDESIGTRGSRFFHAETRAASTRRNWAILQWVVAFLLATTFAAILVPSYTDANRLLHPHVLWWAWRLAGIVLGATLAAGLFRPGLETQKAAREDKRV